MGSIKENGIVPGHQRTSTTQDRVRFAALAALLAGVGILLSSAGFPAKAQQTLKLKVADPFPVSHYIVNEGVKPWLAKATELSGGRLQFDYYPAQQLGKAKDLMNLTQFGVADIGLVAPAYVPDKVPLSVVGELPGMFESTCDGGRALAKLSESGGLLDKYEYKPNGLRVIFAAMLAPYTVMTARGELNSYKDLAGKLVYASGGAKDLTLRRLGAVPVRLSGPETYQAMQRGTIDGTMMAFVGLRPYDLQTLVKYALDGVNLGSTSILFVISEKRWAQIPPDLQKALLEAADYAMKRLCTYSDKSNKDELETLRNAGLKVHSIAGDERDAVLREIDPVTTEWAKNLDTRNLPGTELVKEFLAEVKNRK